MKNLFPVHYIALFKHDQQILQILQEYSYYDHFDNFVYSV